MRLFFLFLLRFEAFSFLGGLALVVLGSYFATNKPEKTVSTAAAKLDAMASPAIPYDLVMMFAVIVGLFFVTKAIYSTHGRLKSY